MIKYSLSYRSRFVDGENGQRVKKAFAYGNAQAVDTMSIEEFADELTKTSVYGSGILQAVIAIVASEIVKKVKNSYIVDLGSLGTFAPGISSEGVEDINDFSANAHIKKVYVKWNKPASLKKISGAKFSKVGTIDEQKALGRATKNAEGTVNIGDSETKQLVRTQNAPQGD